MTKNILILAAIASVLSGCGSVSREDFQEQISTPIEQIIYYASLAGNSHNTQPWFIYVESDSVLYIKADFSRKLHIVDPDSRGLFISVGAFIENLVIAAGSLGYRAEVEITVKHKNDPGIATVHLSTCPKSGYVLSQIENRRTLRTPFQKTELSMKHLDVLIGEDSSKIIYYSASSEKGKFISEQTFAAYTQQANDDQAKQELANWMRFSNSDVEKYRDGLTTSGMGITGFGGFFLRNFYKPEDSMKDSFIKTGIEKTKEQTENCGGWLIIKQNEDSPEYWIKTGQLYQRLNLVCKDLMIGFHPMNQMIEEENFETKAKEHLSLQGVIQFVVRVGYVNEYPPANSVRRSVSEIIKYVN